MDINFVKDNDTKLKNNIYNLKYNENFEENKIQNTNQNINVNKSPININNNNNIKYNFYNVIHTIHTINKNNIENQINISKKGKVKKRRVIKYLRTSKYRGVSKNGNKWQVHMMINKKNKYFGTYDSEEFAAQIYDIISIKNKGFKAITNYKYNFNQIEEIFKNIKLNFIKC